MQQDLKNILGEPENKPTDIKSILGEPENVKKKVGEEVSESSEGDTTADAKFEQWELDLFKHFDENPKSLSTASSVDLKKYNDYKESIGEKAPTNEVAQREDYQLGFKEEERKPVNYFSLFDKKDLVDQANKQGVSVSFVEEASQAAANSEYPIAFLAKRKNIRDRIKKLPEYAPNATNEIHALSNVNIDSRNIDDVEFQLSQIENRHLDPMGTVVSTEGRPMEVNPTRSAYEREVKENPSGVAIEQLQRDNDRLRKAASLPKSTERADLEEDIAKDYTEDELAMFEEFDKNPDRLRGASEEMATKYSDFKSEIASGMTVQDVINARRNIFRGTGSGIAKYVTDYTNLIDQLVENKAVTDLQNKLYRIENGDNIELTTDDKLLMRAIMDNAKLHNDLDGEIPQSYKIGESLGQSLGFMVDFVVSGGGTQAIGKGVLKGVAKRGLREVGETALKKGALSKFGIGTLVKMTQAGIQTAKMPAFYKNTALNVSNGQNFGEAALNAYWETGVESLSERIFMSSPVSGVVGDGATGILRIAGINFNVDKGAVGVFKNTLEEAAEEKIGEIMTAPKDYDSFAEFWKGFTDKEQNSVMLGSVALMTGGMGSVALAGNKFSETQRQARVKRIEKYVPADLRAEIDVITSNVDLSLDQQYSLIGDAISSRIDSQELGEDPATTTANAMQYAQYRVQEQAANTTDENAVVENGEITVGEVEPVGNMQDQLDYLNERGVDANGLNAEQVEKLYNKTKSEEDKQAIDEATGEVGQEERPTVQEEETFSTEALEPQKPIVQMNGEELRAFADEIKQYESNLYDIVFGDMAKEVKQLEISSESIDINKAKKGNERLNQIISSLPSAKQDIWYSEQKYNRADVIDIARNVESVESSENVGELASAIKKPMLELIINNTDEGSLAVLNAARQRAEQLNIPVESLLNTFSRIISRDVRDVDDAMLIVKGALRSIATTSYTKQQKAVEPRVTNLKEETKDDEKEVQEQQVQEQDEKRQTEKPAEEVEVSEEGDEASQEDVVQEVEEFKPFADIVRESETVDEAFKKVSKIKNVPAETSQMFREQYDPEQNLTPKQAFEKFYNVIKATGQPQAPTEAKTEQKGTIASSGEKVAEKAPKQPSEQKIKEASKQIADTLRKAKFTQSINDLSQLKSDPTAPLQVAWDGAIELAAKTIEAGGTVAQAVADGVSYLKESDWYKSLSDNSKKIAEQRVSEDITKTLEDAERDEGAQMRAESKQKEKQGQRDSDMSEGDRSKLQDGEKAEKEKVRQFGQKVTESTILPSDIKKKVKDGGIGYVPRGQKVTKPQARELIRIYSEEGGMDRVKAEIFNPSINLRGDTRVVMATMYVDDRIRKSKQTTDPIEAAKLRADAADVLSFFTYRSTGVAQELESMKVWKDVIGQNPDFVRETVRAEMEKENAEFYDTYKESIDNAQKIIDEYVNSDEFKNKYQKRKGKETAAQRKQRGVNKIANGIDRLASIRGIRKNAVSENEIGDNEFDALKEIADGILDVGIASVEQLVAELKTQVRKYFSPSEIDRVKNRILKETDAKNRLQKKTAKIKLDKTDEEALIDKLYKEMNIATRSQLKKLIADNIELFQAQGLIDDRSFKELVAKAIGRFYVSEKQLDAVEKAAKVINDARNIEENIDNLFDEYIKAVEEKDKPKIARLNKEVNAQLKAYKKAMIEAGIASSEIGSVFADSPTLVKMFATFIQGNLLTPASLKVNLVANALVAPMRFGRNTLASVLDAMLSGMGTTLNKIGVKADSIRSPRWKEVYKKMLDEQRTFMSSGMNSGMFSGALRGLEEGFVQMWRGQAQDDISHRDITNALHPLEAWYDLYQAAKGEEKLRYTEVINKFVEGTFGVPPEIMFRFLNLGDKPFRRAAEQSRLKELAMIKEPTIKKEFLNRVGKDNGLEGAALASFVKNPSKEAKADADAYYKAWEKKFMIRPDEESWEEARKAGLEAVYQNDNVLSDMLKQASDAVSKKSKTGIDSIDKVTSSFMRLAFVSNVPFIKTPTNVVLEALDFAMPVIPFTKGVYNLLQGNRRAFVRNMGTALTGAMMGEFVGMLFGLGIFGLSQGGGEDEPSERTPAKVTNAEYYYRPPYYLNNRALEDFYSNMIYGDNKNLEWKKGDRMTGYTRYGLLSSILMAHAEGYAGMTPEEIANMSFTERQMRFGMPIVKSSLDQSYVKNVSALINAIKGSEYEQESYLVGLSKALRATAIPNSYASYQQAKDNYIRATKEATKQGTERFVTSAMNDIKASYNIGKMPPPRVNIWGEDVERYQDGNSPIFRVFDITKGREYGNVFGLEIFDLYRRTQNNSVFPPDIDNSILVYDDYVKVDGWLYHDMAQYVGQKHKELIKGIIESDMWKSLPNDAIKVEVLQSAYGGRIGDASVPTRTDLAKEYVRINRSAFLEKYKEQHGREKYDDLIKKLNAAQ